MKIKLITVCVAVAVLAVVSPRPAAAISCTQWLNYRMGDSSVKIYGFGLTSFMEGYVEAVNAYGDLLRDNVASKASSEKLAPPPRMTLENAIAGLDRQCTANPSQSAITVGKNEVQTEMRRRATPIVDPTQAAKGNK